MSIRSSLEQSWSYRTVSAIPSPLPNTRFLRLPSHRILEGIPILGLAGYLGMTHGVWGGLFGAIITFGLLELFSRSPSLGLSLLVLAFTALPRIDTALRTEDIIILSLVLAGLRKAKPFQTPIDGTITIWIFSIGLSLAGGLIIGTLISPLQAAFTALKLVEYLLGFYAAYLLRPRLEIPLIIGLLFLGGVGLLETFQGTPRAFNAFPYPAESNHIGGVAVLSAAFALGGIIGQSGRRMWILLLLAGIVTLLSQSRIALLAFIFLLLLQLPQPKTRGAALFLLLLMIGAATLTPLQERLRGINLEWNSYRETRQRVSEGLPPKSSLTRNRFEMWEHLADDYARFPILGSGPGSRHRVIYENSYVMLACEFGAFGVMAFGLLILSIFFALHRTAHSGPDPGSSYGAAFATVAMLILGLTSISFFLAREAGLWWILVGSALASSPPLKSNPPSATVSPQS